MEIIIFWFFFWFFFWLIIAGIIGSVKGQLISGLVWGGLLGPIGVIIVLCLPNLAKQKEEAERKQQLALQLHIQQTQLEQMQRTAPPPGCEQKLRIASNGQELGEMPVATVKLMLKSGKLTPQDYYFDAGANDWMLLDCCPDLM